MFAVPGWSVSAKNLKVEKSIPNQPSKKRKRPSNEDEAIDTSRIEELWSRHIEGKTNGSSHHSLSKKERKRLKHEAAGHNATAKSITSTQKVNQLDGERTTSELQSKADKDESLTGQHEGIKESEEPEVNQDKISKKEKKRKRKKIDGNEATADKPESTAGSGSNTIVPSQGTSKLTPLQAKMRQKLISSRFRHLNETLYTTSSASSLELFKTNPEFFSEYHEGFRRQVKAWPENPLDSFLRWIKERGPVGLGNYKAIRRKTSRKPIANSQANDEDIPSGPESLPRDPRKGICTIVDLGCGDGRLGLEITASSLQKKLKLKVQSYDLASSAPHITIADIRSLPLEDSSVDIAIFCLALMGTNWVEFVEEAYRVLRWKGECWIAEVASRFAKPKSERVEHSVGNRVKETKKAKGKSNPSKQADEDPEDLDLVADMNDTPTSKTDVSAFVSVMRRRGFQLQGEPYIGNKMFVQMRFIKALPPKRGKCAKQERREGKKKFIDNDEDQITIEEEAKVLKPCVYKIR